MFVVEGSFVPTKSYTETLHRKQMKAEWGRLKLEEGEGWQALPDAPPSPSPAGRAPVGAESGVLGGSW